MQKQIFKKTEEDHRFNSSSTKCPQPNLIRIEMRKRMCLDQSWPIVERKLHKRWWLKWKEKPSLFWATKYLEVKCLSHIIGLDLARTVGISLFKRHGFLTDCSTPPRSLLCHPLRPQQGFQTVVSHPSFNVLLCSLRFSALHFVDLFWWFWEHLLIQWFILEKVIKTYIHTVIIPTSKKTRRREKR